MFNLLRISCDCLFSSLFFSFELLVKKALIILFLLLLLFVVLFRIENSVNEFQVSRSVDYSLIQLHQILLLGCAMWEHQLR